MSANTDKLLADAIAAAKSAYGADCGAVMGSGLVGGLEYEVCALAHGKGKPLFLAACKARAIAHLADGQKPNFPKL